MQPTLGGKTDHASHSVIPASLDLGFDDDLGWIFSGAPPGPAGLITAELAPGARLVVDLADPQRLVAYELAAGPGQRPAPEAVELTEALLGPHAARAVTEGPREGSQVTVRPASPHARDDLVRLAVAVGLGAARPAPWWPADIVLLAACQQERLGLSPLARRAGGPAATAYATLTEESFVAQTPGVRARLATLATLLIDLVETPTLRKAVEESHGRLAGIPQPRRPNHGPIAQTTNHSAGDLTVGVSADKQPTFTARGHYHGNILTLELPVAAFGDLAGLWLRATLMANKTEQVIGASRLLSSCHRGHVSCQLGLPPDVNPEALTLTVVAPASKTMAAHRAACSVGAAAAALTRTGINSRAAGLWQDCARSWAGLGDTDREWLAWRMAARDHTADGNDEAAQLAWDNSAQLSAGWAKDLAQGGPAEPFLAEALDPRCETGEPIW